MRWGSPILRVSLGIAMLTVTLLLIADVIFGLSTEAMRPHLAARKHLAETLAVQYSELAAREDYAAMKRAMSLLVERNPEVLSTAMRSVAGQLLAEAGDHRRHWRGAPPVESTETHARVPIFDRDKRWGSLEVRFSDIGQGSLVGLLTSTWFKMLCFMVLAGSVAYFLYMRRTLRHLDPTSVIPGRVKAAFDVLAEGVTFVDDEGRIVLANSTFASMMESVPDQLMGVSLSNLGWSAHQSSDEEGGVPPWMVSLQTGKPRVGAGMVLQLKGAPGRRREFMVNAAPVLDDAKRPRGAIVTFDDVTELERKKQELEDAVTELRRSRDQVRRQNEKLEVMATRDSLTNCLNRRAFIEVLEREVSRARRDGIPLACIMLDIDHFKSVNDTFGHVAGDAAIRFVAGIASEVARGFDIVCRYGGEEFCVLLPTADMDTAWQISERIREDVATGSTTQLSELDFRPLTVSLGVAVLDDTVMVPMDLVDHADGALYVSKSSGRNRTSVVHDTDAEVVSVA